MPGIDHPAGLPVIDHSGLRAGAAGLDAFGAVGLAARAKEDLARWLAAQGRGDEAADLREQARATYQEIGALGWLTQLDTQLPNRVGAGAGAVWSAAACTEGLALREGVMAARGTRQGAPGSGLPSVGVESAQRVLRRQP